MARIKPTNTACASERAPHRALPRRAFTLIEMLVVVAIVLIAVTLVMPSATALWNERKLADSQDKIRGMLMTARANALKAGGVESGLLFYIDERGAQQIVRIEQDDVARRECTPQPTCLAAWDNVFRVMPERRYNLPKPMRVVPRYVAEEKAEGDAEDFEFFSAEELANNMFDDPPESSNQVQRHRNYFTMVYASDGRLLTWRDVLILDDDGQSEDNLGSATGLPVGYDHSADRPNVSEYYRQDDSVAIIDPTGADQEIPFLVTDEKLAAINFPSVDGLMLYDDAVFNVYDADAQEDKREYLLRTALPFYVSRSTGAIIRGPIGEALPDE